MTLEGCPENLFRVMMNMTCDRLTAINSFRDVQALNPAKRF